MVKVYVNIPGVNIGFLPSQLFSVATEFNYTGAGFKFTVPENAQVEWVNRTLISVFGAGIEISRSGDIMTVTPPRAVTTQAPVETGEVAEEEEEEREEEMEEEWEEVAEEETQPTVENRNGLPFFPAQEVPQAPAVAPAEQPVVARQPVAQAPANVMVLSNVVIEQEVPRERAFLAIATAVDAQMASTVNLIKEKQDRFDKEWAALINKKREIDRLTTPIMQRTEISKILAQAERMNRGIDTLIGNVYFTEQNVVIITKELTTAVEINGHRRLIGRMKISVSLKALIGGISSTESVIRIENLDRVCVTEPSHRWDCGHSLNGSVCWGTAWSHLHAAIMDSDIEAIADICIRFVMNPNPSDGFCRHLVHWPIANVEAAA